MKDKDDKIKIFSGFTPDDKFKEAFDHFQEQNIHLKDIRWTQISNIHLTLWFYGQIPKELINNIMAINELLRSKMSKMELTFDKIKIAPNNQNGRMIWASYLPNQEYKAWIRQHEIFLPKLNLGKRDYIQIRPHITLARFKEDLYQNKDINYKNLSFPPTLSLDKLLIWESISNQQKTVYNELKSFNLI